jgi:methyl-accepting chemotaxis protein
MLTSLSRTTNAAIATLLALLTATGLASLWVANHQSEALVQVEEASALIQQQMTADMMHDAIRGDVLAILRAADRGDQAAIKQARADLVDHKATFAESMKGLDRFSATGDLKSKVDTARPLVNAYLASADRLAADAATGTGQMSADYQAYMKQFTALEVGMENISEAIAAHVAKVVEEAHRFQATARIIMLGGMLLSIIFAVLVGIAARRHVVRPVEGLIGNVSAMTAGDLSITLSDLDRPDEIGQLGRAIDRFRQQLLDARQSAERVRKEQTALICNSIGSALEELAKGNLTARVSADLTGDFARLKLDLNAAMTELCRLIGEIARVATSVREGSAEIESATADLARRTEGNAATIEQTTATLVEVNSRVQSAATASQETARRAVAMRSVVEAGRQTAADAVAVMGRVNESAKGIDAVIEGLDKIAFQTRVLAMNAAVEAGRAGEAGKGFAVVADLVSALAMRAEDEARHAREQIVVTQTEISAAADAVQTVDDALQRIATDVNGVHELIETVVQESRSQSMALSEITVAVQSMDQATQANAAMVEQASAAARSLSSEIGSLASNADRFRVAA